VVVNAELAGLEVKMRPLWILARTLAATIFGAMLAFNPAHASIIVFSGNLDSGQVVAVGGSTSTATGFGVVAIDTTLFTITTDLSWIGLSGPADRAHLHNASAGQVTDLTFEHDVLGLFNSDPARTVPCPWDDGVGFTNCAPATGSTDDVLQLSATDGYGFPDFDSLVTVFLQGGIYLDIHTQLFPDGEIRGQLSAVSEPSTTILLFCAGLVGAALSRRREH
jgi:CHRD domain/PEP-CTERM motif